MYKINIESHAKEDQNMSDMANCTNKIYILEAKTLYTYLLYKSKNFNTIETSFIQFAYSIYFDLILHDFLL